MSVVQCRTCHLVLLANEHSTLLTCHNFKVGKESSHDPCTETDCRDDINSIYLQEGGLPEWFLPSFMEGDSQKGEIRCPYCSVRLGSFDLKSERKCHCNKFVLPPVQFIKSKVVYQLVDPNEKYPIA